MPGSRVCGITSSNNPAGLSVPSSSLSTADQRRGVTIVELTRLQRAGRQRVVEGLRDAVHVPLDPPPDGVLDLAGVVLDPEALALSRHLFREGQRRRVRFHSMSRLRAGIRGAKCHLYCTLNYSPAKGGTQAQTHGGDTHTDRRAGPLRIPHSLITTAIREPNAPQPPPGSSLHPLQFRAVTLATIQPRGPVNTYQQSLQ